MIDQWAAASRNRGKTQTAMPVIVRVARGKRMSLSWISKTMEERRVPTQKRRKISASLPRQTLSINLVS